MVQMVTPWKGKSTDLLTWSQFALRFQVKLIAVLTKNVTNPDAENNSGSSLSFCDSASIPDSSSSLGSPHDQEFKVPLSNLRDPKFILTL